MKLGPGDLTDPRVLAMLTHHVTTARAETAPGSAHALDLAGLKAADIAFFALWDDDTLLAIGALKRLSPHEGEVKSMHTLVARRRSGAGSIMLRHLIETARRDGVRTVYLETGSWDYFQPARAFYRRHGFVECPPFGDYAPDPNSVFMRRDLAPLP